MKLPLLFLVFIISFVLADDLETLKKLQGQLPKCSLQCLAQGAAEHGCAITDIACQCTKMEAMIKTVAPCLAKAGCELKDITNAAGTVAEICADQAVAGNTTQTVPDLGTNQPSKTGTVGAAVETAGAARVIMQGMGWTGTAVAAIAAYLI